MQIKIGNKIRELRHRDGRKQEDLANALGVTAQAISRWEQGGGYPDMELLPAITNYFNVSIDELFGYSKDREEKLKGIFAKADKALNEQDDMTDCIQLLHSAIMEFPSEPMLLVKLGYALNHQGWQKYGGRSYTEDGSDYAHNDTEYNSKNEYWQEAMKIFEKVLTMDIPKEDRDAIINIMISTYANMGYYDKAKTLAEKQTALDMSRELLLTKATESEERDRFQGEAIIALLVKLKEIVISSVQSKVSVFTGPIAAKTMIDLAVLFESVFSDGRCGEAHRHIQELYFYAAMYEARNGDVNQAFEYFCRSFKHYKSYEALYNERDYKYTAPLVSKVRLNCEDVVRYNFAFWLTSSILLPENLKSIIRKDDRFKEYSDRLK